MTYPQDLTRLTARFWRHVDISAWEADTNEHWYWTASTAGGSSHRNHYGYGRLNVKRQNGPQQTIYAHRFFYELFNGPIADGFWIDHLCGFTICVNPDHLDLVTPSQNVRSARLHPAMLALERKASTRRKWDAQIELIKQWTGKATATEK